MKENKDIQSNNIENTEKIKESKKSVYIVMILSALILFVAVFFAINGKKNVNNLIAKKIVEHIITNIEKKHKNAKFEYKSVICEESATCYINDVVFKENNQTLFTAKKIKITNVINFAKLVDKYKNKQDISNDLQNFNIEVGAEKMRVPAEKYNISEIKYFKKHYKYSDIDVSDYLMNIVLAAMWEEIKDPNAKQWLTKNLSDISDINKYTYIGFKVATKFNDMNKTKLQVRNDLYLVSGKSHLDIAAIYIINNWRDIIYAKIKNKSDYTKVTKNILLKKIIIDYFNEEKQHLKNLTNYVLSKIITSPNKLEIKGKLTNQKVEKYFNEILIMLGSENNNNKVKVYNIESYKNGKSHVKIEFIFNDTVYDLINNTVPMYFMYLRKFNNPDTALGFTMFTFVSLLSQKIVFNF